MGKNILFNECVSSISKRMKIKEQDLQERLPSGAETKFRNRCGWSRTYLKKAGLLTAVKPGVFIITSRGEKALKEGPDVLTDEYLLQFDGFKEFLHGGKKEKRTNDSPSEDNESTPDEIMEKTIEQLNTSLEKDVLEAVLEQDDSFFERLVVKLLQTMGYGDEGIVTPRSCDGGVDGIISEDKLGFSKIFIQAKRWKPDTVVSRPEINKFVGALADKHATKGLFITTARFSKEAKISAANQNVILVDGEILPRCFHG